MRSRTPSVAALLFGSGCCALVYQIGWLREFRLIFGASTAASAAVLAIFIGGLGFGGLLLALVRQLYVAAGGTSRLGLAAGTIGRLVLSALVLAVPTIFMGGTLPA